MRRILFVVLLLCVLGESAAHAANNVFLRTAPLSLMAHGATLAPQPGIRGGRAAWFPEMIGVGIGTDQFDYAVHMTTLHPLPKEDEFSVLYGRFNVAFRPLKLTPSPLVDPYVFAGGGFGGAGYYRKNAGCQDDPADECSRSRDGFGGGLHGGFGVEFNIPLVSLGQSGQRLGLFLALEIRGELFLHRGANYFMVYSLPIGLRFD